jgi:hypothetical protein
MQLATLLPITLHHLSNAPLNTHSRSKKKIIIAASYSGFCVSFAGSHLHHLSTAHFPLLSGIHALPPHLKKKIITAASYSTFWITFF